MKQAFDLALEQTERSLGSIDWNSYGSILFISKALVQPSPLPMLPDTI